MINKSENKRKMTWKIIKKETGKTQVSETNFQLNFEAKNTKNQNEVAYDCNTLFLSLAENLMADHPSQHEVIKQIDNIHYSRNEINTYKRNRKNECNEIF
jgi:hypothetical protein